ncbi:MAG: beta-galactosidase, partial [Lentisphaeria bacterium]|nr:beta-galactosidase [Lentisphaeria bacterium]
MIFEHEKVSLAEIGKLKHFTSAEISAGDSGFSIGFECLDREMFDPEKCYGLLGETGMKWARCQTGWNRCETVKGVYDFAWLDSVVDQLLSHHVQPWFNVGYGNKLYMSGLYSDAAVGFVPLYFGEETLQAWKNYVRALAKHFKGRVSIFEIWNESNISTFWQPK